MARGKWRVYSNFINGYKFYIVGRLLDDSKPLHGGNVEYHGGYTDNRLEAEAGADFLNKAEKIRVGA